jgi:hypothetical protein
MIFAPDNTIVITPCFFVSIRPDKKGPRLFARALEYVVVSVPYHADPAQPQQALFTPPIMTTPIRLMTRMKLRNTD